MYEEPSLIIIPYQIPNSTHESHAYFLLYRKTIDMKNSQNSNKYLNMYYLMMIPCCLKNTLNYIWNKLGYTLLALTSYFLLIQHKLQQCQTLKH